MAVTLIDAQEMGGTCLNRGCIPSKFFLSRANRSSEAVASILQLEAEKDTVLKTLRQRMEQAAKSLSIRRMTGKASLVSAQEVDVVGVQGTEHLTADTIILATGTSPIIPTSFPKHPAIFTSDTIFSIDYLPAHLVVVGGGYIGSELACAFQGLGSKVTLVEKEKNLLATQPEFLAAAPVLQRAFEKRGMTVWAATEVKSVVASDPKKLLVTCSNGETVEANALLLALGRRPNTDGLGVEKAGLPAHGSKIAVNEFMQTSVPSIYAIGDLVSPLPLAHTAAKEAEVAIRHLAGEKGTAISYTAIPRCIYTQPEVAAIGLSESQAQSLGHKTRIDRYHFAASSKAMIDAETEGFWMIVSDSDSRKILGALIIGPHATELIHLIALSLRAGFTTADVADTVFAHPTLAEGFQEVMHRAASASQAAKKNT
jgi:dihydrolipoamide dehydrogenase